MAQGMVMYKKGSCTVTINKFGAIEHSVDTYTFTMSYSNETVTLATSSPVWLWNGTKQMTFKYVGDQGHESLAFGYSDGFLSVGQYNSIVEVNVTMTQAGPNPILEIVISLPSRVKSYSISPSKIQLMWEKEKSFTWDISGKVETLSGEAIPGATIKAYLNGTTSSAGAVGTKLLKTTQSKSNGSYGLSLQVPIGTGTGNYVVLKTIKSNYTFKDVLVEHGGTYNIKGEYYQIAPTKFNIVGRFEDGSGNGIAKAKIIYQSIPTSVNTPIYATTDSNGNFEFKNQVTGGFISPVVNALPSKYQKCQYSQVEVTNTNYTDIIITPHNCSWTPSTYKITGKVVSSTTNSAVSGAKVSYNGNVIYTSSDGSFSLEIKKLDGTLTITHQDYNPVSETIAFASELNVGTVALAPTVHPHTYYIQGTIEDVKTGKAVSGALVAYNDNIDTTASGGSFEFKDIVLGKQLKVTKSGYNPVSMYIYDTEPDLVIHLQKKGSVIEYVQYVYLVEDQSGNGIPGIQLVIGGTTYTTNNAGEIAVKLGKGSNPVSVVSSLSDPSDTYGDFKVISTVEKEVIYQGKNLHSRHNCGTNAEWNGTACVCDSGYQKDSSGNCVKSTHNCGTNAEWNGTACVCDSGYQRDSSGNCVKKTVIGQTTTTSNTWLIIGAAVLVLIVLMKK